ncbi:acyl-CoA-binding domain-containing protein 5-like isoform X1 [Palaemon carinicauda]|uniref:acyl-CoA-binding domain-containing protein 5-like isoform X1 n=1 Tax=Palaemon carinicauda TaxID=392227 RepID=UPI0035B6A4D1
MTSEERFNAAVNIIKCLPKDGPFQPSHEMMLKFYGLYKQAVEGPCHEPKPAFYEVVKGYKWRAWKSLGDMPKRKAMDSYVDELKKIVETMSYTQDVANFIDALGPFYEFIDIPSLKPKNNNNVKGLDDSPSFRDNNAEEESGVANGHIDKVNGDVRSDAETGSETQTSSESSSPELVSAGSNFQAVPLSLDQELIKVEEEEDEELVVMKVVNSVENTTTHTVTLSPKVYSDSESDEEYSEPAEMSVDFLITEPKITPQQSVDPLMSTPQQNISVDHSMDSTDSGIKVTSGPMVCGGGDQSHPGGLQMTPRGLQGSSYGTSLYGSSENRNAAAFAQSSNLLRSSGSGGGMGEGGGRKGSGSSVSDDVNAQLVILLRRLQNDMENVLHRLNTLETLTLTQHHTHCHHCHVGNSRSVTVRSEGSWWPFPELSPRTTFFLLVWPFILHGGIKLLLLLRSRRRRQ